MTPPTPPSETPLTDVIWHETGAVTVYDLNGATGYPTQQAYAEALERRLREAEAAQCKHGWHGTVPENGQQIATPCPACGARSLFIGAGGHLTCARVPSDKSHGCSSPSVEETVKSLKQRAEAAERRVEREGLPWCEVHGPYRGSGCPQCFSAARYKCRPKGRQ